MVVISTELGAQIPGGLVANKSGVVEITTKTGAMSKQAPEDVFLM